MDELSKATNEKEIKKYFDNHPLIKLGSVGCLAFLFIAFVALVNGIVIAFELLPLAIILGGK